MAEQAIEISRQSAPTIEIVLEPPPVTDVVLSQPPTIEIVFPQGRELHVTRGTSVHVDRRDKDRVRVVELHARH
jgi:hypothetical protein